MNGFRTDERLYNRSDCTNILLWRGGVISNCDIISSLCAMAYPYAGENQPSIYRRHGKLIIDDLTSDNEDIEFCDHVQFPVEKYVERDSSELLYFIHGMILQLLPLPSSPHPCGNSITPTTAGAITYFHSRSDASIETLSEAAYPPERPFTK
mmetsp:Transcript_5992/g.10936  ORF Transcript_5992/g.10936 Transcript_5992/m.10936 type:complete len:152 (-) Transcript_5992:543-998(-)